MNSGLFRPFIFIKSFEICIRAYSAFYIFIRSRDMAKNKNFRNFTTCIQVYSELYFHQLGQNMAKKNKKNILKFLQQ
ncbi:hypothetical protein PUN28_020343 [Cardiocondyla obscurior]|uniref:Uncharacterized protein n=1 Tax=Cardiocondyla obscurior TaxID=286306 RepID=A0AAW2E6Q6_9HYME